MANSRNISDLEKREREERIERVVSSQALSIEDILRHAECPPWLTEDEWRAELAAKGYANGR